MANLRSGLMRTTFGTLTTFPLGPISVGTSARSLSSTTKGVSGHSQNLTISPPHHARSDAASVSTYCQHGGQHERGESQLRRLWENNSAAFGDLGPIGTAVPVL